MKRRTVVGAARLFLVAALANCTSQGTEGRPWHEDSMPPIWVALPTSAAALVERDSARWANAPPVHFAAIIGPDPDHTVPVVAPGSAELRLVSIRARGAVERGDTLALVRGSADGTEPPLLASSSEIWWPRRRAGEALAPGDTVGVIQHPGRFIAVGQVETVEAANLQPGDNAVVTFPGRPPISTNGRIAAITTARYRVEVAVHFHRSENPPESGGLAQVSIFPTGERSKVLVVPATSIAMLPQGPALFLPRGHGVFEIRFVSSDEHEGGTRVVHQGLDGPNPVAVGDLHALIAAAKDSFQARGRGRR